MLNPKTVLQLIHRMAKYSIVGILNTSLGITSMILLAKTGMHYVYYTAITCMIGMIISFTLNFHFTFRVSGEVHRRFILFIVIGLTNLVILEGLQIFLIHYLGFSHLLGVGLGMIWYSLFGFAMNQFFVFRPELGRKLFPSLITQ